MPDRQLAPRPLLERRLRAFQCVAIADVVLLVALLTGSALDAREAVAVLGPLHGANVLLLTAMAANGAGEGLWSWALPLGVMATGGPLGAFIGHALVRRRLSSWRPPDPLPSAASERSPLALRAS